MEQAQPGWECFHFFFFFFFFLKIYLIYFIFGCIGSSLMHAGFL